MGTIGNPPGGAMTADQVATNDRFHIVDVSVGSVDPSNKYLEAAELQKLLGPLLTPGGRLTLVSGTPVLTSDQTAKTAVYYTPYVSDVVPLYTGSAWLARTFTELTLSLDATNHPAEKVFDVFIFDNSGTVSIGTGPAWAYASTVTLTIATPCVVSWTGHGLVEGDPVVFTTTGALPTGITAGTTYYVGRSPGANSFNISTSIANAAAGTFVATSGSQSGTHTVTNATRARGAGAGTTELEIKNGRWTNKNSLTIKNGAGAGVAGIAANKALYVGSIYCTANGQTAMTFTPAAASGGTNNVLGVWNAYNRVRTTAISRDSTATWTYSSTTYRATNNSTSNRVRYVDGLGQSSLATFTGVVGDSGYAACGASRNSTTVAPQITGANVAPSVNTGGLASCADLLTPNLGFNYIQAMEAVVGGSVTFYGGGSTPTRQHQSLIVNIDM